MTFSQLSTVNYAPRKSIKSHLPSYLMSQTPPMTDSALNGRDRTPELTTKREKRYREEEEEDDRDRSHRSNRHRRDRDRDGEVAPEEEDKERRHRRRERGHERENETEEERKERHRRRDEETEEERRERHRRRDEETEEERRERHRRREEETEEERDERRRKRREREREREKAREREREREPDVSVSVDRERRRSRDQSADVRSTHTHTHSRRDRDRSRESHRSHRSRDVEPHAGPNLAIREMTREEKEAEREKRDREMAEERRQAARLREERFAEIDRERELERRRMRDYSPPRRRRPSPSYDRPPSPRGGGRDRDPVTALLDEVDSEARSILVTQLSVKMTSADLGLFFEDKLGRGAVRDARVVLDKVSRRSKGIGYVELDAVELVNRAIGLSGTIVMGLPIQIMLTEAERNRQGQAAAALAGGGAANGGFNQSSNRPPVTFGASFPPLSTGLALPAGIEPNAHGPDAAIPYHRLFVSNLTFTLGADDIRQVFEPFGDVEFVDLHVDFSGQRKGTAYVQFKDLSAAQMALDAMNNFDLAGRMIRVQTIQDRAYNNSTIEQIEETGNNYGTRLDANQRQQLMFKLARTEPNVNLALSAHKPVVQSKSPSLPPSPFVVVSNMFNPEEETERNWDLDLAEDVKGEVEGKYGKVKRIKVEKMSAGEVYIEFEEIQGATKAIKGLNARYFGGRQLQATYISETLFKAHL